MRIGVINDELLEQFMIGKPVRCERTQGNQYIFSTNGNVAYVLGDSELYFNPERVFSPYTFSELHKINFEISEANRLEKMFDLYCGKNGEILCRLKGKHWDTFVNTELLEAFDVYHFYQEKCLGIIVVTELHHGTEMIRGYVAPIRTGLEKAQHYADSPDIAD